MSSCAHAPSMRPTRQQSNVPARPVATEEAMSGRVRVPAVVIIRIHKAQRNVLLPCVLRFERSGRQGEDVYACRAIAAARFFFGGAKGKYWRTRWTRQRSKTVPLSGKNSGIETTTVTHPPLYTVEQSQALRGQIAGAHTKNLFLRDRKDAHFLVTVGEEAEIDLKRIHTIIGASGRVSFGKPEKLLEYLGVVPGAVTAFGLLNEQRRQCQVRPGFSLGRSGDRQRPSPHQRGDDVDLQRRPVAFRQGDGGMRHLS